MTGQAPQTTLLSDTELAACLGALEGAPYDRYRTLAGKTFRLRAYRVRFRHIQGSPGAFPASVIDLDIHPAELGLPFAVLDGPVRRLAGADFLLRRLRAAIDACGQGNRGADGSGSFQPLALPQQILERNVVRLRPDLVRISLRISLPGSAGSPKILGHEARAMLLDELPAALEHLAAAVADNTDIAVHCAVVEDHAVLRERLAVLGLVAFIADGARLARASGTSDLPGSASDAISFASPPELAVEAEFPNAGRVRGMGIPCGVNVIVGGGFQGKSTLLSALAKGVYPHIPGDGRERVVTCRDAMLVEAEPGRAVRGTDITPFVGVLPGRHVPARFHTDNASGSTSEAAATVEAIAAGSRLLLYDEDSSATNFLIGDPVMRRLVPDDPITPLVERVRGLYASRGISTVLVVGGSSAYLGVADRVVRMRDFRAADVTAEAHALVTSPPADLPWQGGADDRRLSGDNFDPSYRPPRRQIDVAKRIKPLRLAHGVLEYGNDTLDLTALAALVDESQILAIGYALLAARQHDEWRELSPSTLAERLARRLEERSLDLLGELCPETPLFLAMPRLQELAAAINRLRSLRLAG